MQEFLFNRILDKKNRRKTLQNAYLYSLAYQNIYLILGIIPYFQLTLTTFLLVLDDFRILSISFLTAFPTF